MDAGATGDGHEVAIRVPTWDDVPVEVFGDASPRGRTEIEADIETMGFKNLGDGIFQGLNDTQGVMQLLLGKIVDFAGDLVWNHEAMGGIVRESV